MPTPKKPRDPLTRIRELEDQVERLKRRRPIVEDVGGATPTGGVDGDVKTGTGKIWWRSGGSWYHANSD